MPSCCARREGCSSSRGTWPRRGPLSRRRARSTRAEPRLHVELSNVYRNLGDLAGPSTRRARRCAATRGHPRPTSPAASRWAPSGARARRARRSARRCASRPITRTRSSSWDRWSCGPGAPRRRCPSSSVSRRRRPTTRRAARRSPWRGGSPRRSPPRPGQSAGTVAGVVRGPPLPQPRAHARDVPRLERDRGARAGRPRGTAARLLLPPRSPQRGAEIEERLVVAADLEGDRLPPALDGLRQPSLVRRDDAEAVVGARQAVVDVERRLEGLPGAGPVAGHEVDRARVDEDRRVRRVDLPGPREGGERLLARARARQGHAEGGQHVEVRGHVPRVRLEERQRLRPARPASVR